MARPHKERIWPSWFGVAAMCLIFLAVSFSLVYFVFPLFAQPTDTLSVGTAEGPPGSRVSIPISLQSTTPIGGIRVHLAYDETRLENPLVTLRPGIEDVIFDWNIPTPGELRFLIASADATTIPSTGTLVSADFTIDGMAPRDVTPITVTTLEAADPDATPVPLTWTAGFVDVTMPQPVVSNTAVITAHGAVIVDIDISPSDLSATVGKVYPMTAIGTFSDGSRRDVTCEVFWDSIKPSVADFTGCGILEVFSEGNTDISASW